MWWFGLSTLGADFPRSGAGSSTDVAGFSTGLSTRSGGLSAGCPQSRCRTGVRFSVRLTLARIGRRLWAVAIGRHGWTSPRRRSGSKWSRRRCRRRCSVLSQIRPPWSRITSRRGSDLPPVAALRVGLELDLAVVAALAVAASFFAGDARVAVVAGSLGFLAVGYRRIDRRVPFSFGEGFLGYRADLGWPRGVQEDDDVHWNWNGATRRRDSAA